MDAVILFTHFFSKNIGWRNISEEFLKFNVFNYSREILKGMYKKYFWIKFLDLKFFADIMYSVSKTNTFFSFKQLKFEM